MKATSTGADLLRDNRQEIQRIAAKHGAYNARVFGSFAHLDLVWQILKSDLPRLKTAVTTIIESV